MNIQKITKNKDLTAKTLFAVLVIIGFFPLFFSKYFLTLDGPGHIYNGNIVKELVLGNLKEFSNLFIINPLPVPNWISHFLFAVFNLVFPDFISEKIVLGIYLVLFPMFFRKTVLWFNPNNHAFSLFGILFAHNHLLYLGSYNLDFALAFFFATIYYILKYANHFRFSQVTILAGLFLLVYFSHILVLLVSFAVAVVLPLAVLKIEKSENSFSVTNWNLFYTKLKVVTAGMIPSLAFAVMYLVKVDSLEEAGRMGLDKLISWLIDIRPMLTLCICSPWTTFTNTFFGILVIMIVTNLYLLIKNNCSHKDDKLLITVPKPGFQVIWFLMFLLFLILYLIVPNANILPERLIIFVFIFLGFWIATQNYPRWMHLLFAVFVVVSHITFSILHTINRSKTSIEIEQMNEVTKHIPEGSLLLPFNYAYYHNWLHMHSSGYFGSDKPIAVIENYEGALQWFPVKWNLKGPYNLEKINVWAADNRKMIDNMYSNPDNPDVFSLPLKDCTSTPIPYVVVFGKIAEEHKDSYNRIKSILDDNYYMVFKNDFCQLYQME